MPAQDDVTFIVLRAYRGLADLRITFVPGTHVVRANCGHRAWISPGGEDHLAQINGYTICSDCQAQVPNLDREVATVPGAVDNIREALGERAAEIAQLELRWNGVEER